MSNRADSTMIVDWGLFLSHPGLSLKYTESKRKQIGWGKQNNRMEGQHLIPLVDALSVCLISLQNGVSGACTKL